MNAAAAEAVTHDIPATALYALPMLGLALRRIEAIRAGQPVPQSPEADALSNAPETHPVALLLDEIL